MNRLKDETSPYLLQHANNPVDWYPWGDEAFGKAKAENKPILLSIGYAACHWCHVMAHESFEDEETAGMMNQYFVNIKVDREERPDVDQIYMNAVVAMTRQGGWPLTAVLTPDGKPFFGGTYFPKEERYGMPSFKRVLLSLAQSWQTEQDKLENSANSITEVISEAFGLFGEGEAGIGLSQEVISRSANTLATQFDAKWGGFGGAPKFPQPMNLEFLMRIYSQSEDANALHILIHTLDMMARGGMYDHIGGGFTRYSTDVKWLVPHFEKMLYDNAQLARVYLHAWQITKRPQYKAIVEEILDYVVREMTHADGGFYSSQDADSEGEEGKFYVWSLEEVQTILEDDVFPVSVYFDITAHGNWEGKNIPNMPRSHEEVAGHLKMSPEELEETVARAKQKLYDARSQRVWPGLDDKILTSWNGLMLAAFAEAGRVLERQDYLDVALKNAQFLYNTMRQPNGRLLRTWKAGYAAKYNGYLEDYAFLADGLLALYQATFDQSWFQWARELGDLILNHFSDSANGGLFDTSDDHEELIFRPKDVQDNAIPSGNSAAMHLFLQLSLYTGDARYYDVAAEGIGSMEQAVLQYPGGFGHWLNGALLIAGDTREIAIAGDPAQLETKALIQTAQSKYRPYDVVAVGPPESDPTIPLMLGRDLIDGMPAAYVCRNFACQLPVSNPDELEKLLI